MRLPGRKRAPQDGHAFVRRRWWSRRRGTSAGHANVAELDEGRHVWRVAWWGEGWGVWPGRKPDVTTMPAYSAEDISQAKPEVAAHWAFEVVPPLGRTVIECPPWGVVSGSRQALR
ncbi:hypothetical protein AB0F17_41255 [Nonomuraea sp. NPDC026600]|uniref:hypothetical protein n=1 Tax=Nonomuraea sp. NPDC026600 TaxID=3155363 RepID=UPI0033FED957